MLLSLKFSGFFQFEECGDIVNPTLILQVGKVYTFIQADESNNDHPMGFSYYPDGAQNGLEELEPGIALGTDTSCTDDLTCPAPMYFVDSE